MARRLWFGEPAKALADPVRLLAYAMTFGTHEDMPTFRRYVSHDDMREALERAPPGIFDGRSWSYWHLMLDRWPPAAAPRTEFAVGRNRRPIAGARAASHPAFRVASIACQSHFLRRASLL